MKIDNANTKCSGQIDRSFLHTQESKVFTVVRFATRADLPAVNQLRKQVNDLHVAGKPEIFKSGFSPELQDYLYVVFDSPDRDVAVAEQNGQIVGFACLHAVHRPETPYM